MKIIDISRFILCISKPRHWHPPDSMIENLITYISPFAFSLGHFFSFPARACALSVLFTLRLSLLSRDQMRIISPISISDQVYQHRQTDSSFRVPSLCLPFPCPRLQYTGLSWSSFIAEPSPPVAAPTRTGLRCTAWRALQSCRRWLAEQ